MRGPGAVVALAVVLILLGIAILLWTRLVTRLLDDNPHSARSGPSWWRRWLDGRRKARRRQADAEVPWRHYSRPDLTSGRWKVGIERVADDGRVLNPPHEMFDLRHEPRAGTTAADVLDAEGQAWALALDYTARRVGM